MQAQNQGPVVQSVVSLTSSLRVISLTVLADSIYNILILFAEKMWVAFAVQKLLTFFFSKNIQHICVSLDVNFNESLTNDVVSFEQLGPEFQFLKKGYQVSKMVNVYCLCVAFLLFSEIPITSRGLKNSGNRSHQHSITKTHLFKYIENHKKENFQIKNLIFFKFLLKT